VHTCSWRCLGPGWEPPADTEPRAGWETGQAASAGSPAQADFINTGGVFNNAEPGLVKEKAECFPPTSVRG